MSRSKDKESCNDEDFRDPEFLKLLKIVAQMRQEKIEREVEGEISKIKAERTSAYTEREAIRNLK